MHAWETDSSSSNNNNSYYIILIRLLLLLTIIIIKPTHLWLTHFQLFRAGLCDTLHIWLFKVLFCFGDTVGRRRISFLLTNKATNRGLRKPNCRKAEDTNTEMKLNPPPLLTTARNNAKLPDATNVPPTLFIDIVKDIFLTMMYLFLLCGASPKHSINLLLLQLKF